MQRLPPELLQIICSFLQPVPDLLRLSRVSKRWLASCSAPQLWKQVVVSAECFPASSERRNAWNRFAKRAGKYITELHITLPRTLRMSEHHHPLTRSSYARTTGMREVCSVCQNSLGDTFFICKIPACVWTECEECRLTASLPLSLVSFSALSSLTFDRAGPWCWGLPCCGLSLQEKALRTVRTSKLRELCVMGVPVSGHSGIEKWFVKQRALERLSLYIASGCVLDLCTAFWSSLRDLCLFASDSVSWNVIGVMHLISVDCPLLEQLSISFLSAGTFPIYNLSPLSRMRSLQIKSRQESVEIDVETLNYVFRSLDMKALETLELKGMAALAEHNAVDLLLSYHPSLKRLSVDVLKVAREQLLGGLILSTKLEELSLAGDCTEPFPALDLPRPPDWIELSPLLCSNLRFVCICSPLTERTVWTLGLLPKLEVLEIRAPSWLRAQIVKTYYSGIAPFAVLRKLKIEAEPAPSRAHVSDEFLASLLPSMPRLECLELFGLSTVTGAGWINSLSTTNPLLSAVLVSGARLMTPAIDTRANCAASAFRMPEHVGAQAAEETVDPMESEPA